MQTPRLIMLICFCFVLSAGCGSPQISPTMSPQDASFQSVISIQLSSDLVLSPEEDKTIRIHDTKNIYLKNLSSECVIFPSDHGVSIWFYKNGQWVGVKDLMVILDPHDIILKPKGEMFSERGFLIFPDYEVLASEKPSSIRIAIAGRLCENGSPTDTIVGNYIDLQVVP